MEAFHNLIFKVEEQELIWNRFQHFRAIAYQHFAILNPF